MDREIEGFTLIEVLIVLAIMRVLLGLAVPSYTHWRAERQLTADTQKVLSFVQKRRSKAYSTKRSIQLTIDGSNTICDDMGNCVRTQNDFNATESSISISSRGVYENEHIRIEDQDKIDKYDPQYSCVIMTSTRARLGRYDGSNCNAK